MLQPHTEPFLVVNPVRGRDDVFFHRGASMWVSDNRMGRWVGGEGSEAFGVRLDPPASFPGPAALSGAAWAQSSAPGRGVRAGGHNEHPPPPGSVN